MATAPEAAPQETVYEGPVSGGTLTPPGGPGGSNTVTEKFGVNGPQSHGVHPWTLYVYVPLPLPPMFADKAWLFPV